MPKKEEMMSQERAMEEAKKRDEKIAEKTPLSKAEIFKTSLPGKAK